MADLAVITEEGKPALREELIERLARQLGEADAGLAWRRAALEIYRGMALPDRVVHLWRYTDPLELMPRRPLTGEMVTAEPPGTVELPDGLAVVVRPGLDPLVSEAAASSGITIARLFADPRDGDDLGRTVPVNHGFFEALNAAAFDASVVVRLPRGLELTDPLRILVPAVKGTMVPRILVVAEPLVRGTVVEEHTGGGDESLVLGVTEIHVGHNSEVRHVLTQNWAPGTRGHLTVRGCVERSGRFLSATASFGGQTVKTDVGADLAGPGARSELIGVALAEKRQHLDHHTVHRHVAGNTWSNIDFKVAVADRARSVYTGLIRIEADARTSEAYQENRNLLLGERARADTIPELEILNEDVSCSHGATAAPIDPEQVFYLQSRGLTAADARRQIVRGFVEPTLVHVPESLRPGLEAEVETRLRRLEEEARP